MKIQAKILADSISERGDRITTYLLTFPRIILAEFNTHRSFSRNSASSRAIPFKKMVESVEKNPFIPIAWQKDHKGMQGTEYITSKDDIENCISVWLKARNDAVKQSICLNGAEGFERVTKQLCNRLLEPFMWHTVICTATEWDNFFNLRCPEYLINWYPKDRPEALEPSQAIFKSRKDAIARTEGECDKWTEKDWRECNISQAEIHIQALAEAMWDAMNESTPNILHIRDWHIPFADEINKMNDNWAAWGDLTKKEIKLKIATAKCARVSYTTVGSTSNSSHTADIELHNKLIESGHYSPLEHCAQVMDDTRYNSKPYSKNFKGFIQYREIVES
jgi:thymidylate synthase ThyX